MDAKSLVITIALILVMFAIPSFETTRKAEIIELFALFAKLTGGISERGFFGMVFYSGLVAIWDGLSVLPVRYVEFLVALNYPHLQDFIIIVVIGKTLGAVLTYRLSYAVLSRDELQHVMLNNTTNFYFKSLESIVSSHPYSFAITIKLFFPSTLASHGLALILSPADSDQRSANRLQQFVLISFLSAILAAIPAATLDFYPYLRNKVFTEVGLNMRLGGPSETDLI